MIAKKVKKALIDQDLTVTRLAEITGFTLSHLSNVINGHFDSQRVKKSISLALGRDFQELWDDLSDHKSSIS